MHMIKKAFKCPRCKKTLLLRYSAAVRSITCACGCQCQLKERQQQRKEVRKV